MWFRHDASRLTDGGRQLLSGGRGGGKEGGRNHDIHHVRPAATSLRKRVAASWHVRTEYGYVGVVQSADRKLRPSQPSPSLRPLGSS